MEAHSLYMFYHKHTDVILLQKKKKQYMRGGGIPCNNMKQAVKKAEY